MLGISAKKKQTQGAKIWKQYTLYIIKKKQKHEQATRITSHI